MREVLIVTAKHGQSPINPTLVNKSGHLADLVATLPDASNNPAAQAIAAAAACGPGSCGFVQDDDKSIPLRLIREYGLLASAHVPKLFPRVQGFGPHSLEIRRLPARSSILRLHPGPWPAACNNTSHMLRVPEIASAVQKRFDRRDLVFAVRVIDRLGDKRQRIRAVGKAEGRPVEFEVVLGPDWKKAKLGNILTLYGGVVEIRSVGPRSDEFLKALDSVYRTDLRPESMAQRVEFGAISLQGNPLRLSSGPLNLKLFFEREEEEHAQLYLDIERACTRVYLREKDARYRAPIVRALAAARGEIPSASNC